MTDVLAGLRYPLRALGIINRNPRLWKYIAVPVAVNVVVGFALYFGLLFPTLAVLDRAIPDETSALAGFLLWTAWVLLGLTLAVGVGFLLVRFGVVLGAPWYGQLSEELEAMLTGRSRPAKPLDVREVAYDILRALQFEGKKLLLALGVWLPSLLLLLIPGLGGFLYAAAGVTIGATISCLDFFDGPLERRRLRFRQKLGLIRRLLPGSASFGIAAFGLVSIPGVNLLAIPLFVTAGNMLVIEQVLMAEGAPAPAPAAPPPPAAESGERAG